MRGLLPLRRTLDGAPPWITLADPDVRTYVRAVEAADGAQLEMPVRRAIYQFITGCKDDGIWPAIKACCILAGARTLSGALVPLVGAAPTNFNFVSVDYNRKTGLVGDGTTKYLNSNRNDNSDPQDNAHAYTYVSTAGTFVYLGSTFGFSRRMIGVFGGLALFFNRSNPLVGGSVSYTGGAGVTRSNSTEYSFLRDKSVQSVTSASQEPGEQSVNVFTDSPVAYHSTARLSFYSIGENLDLALLDARVTALMNTLATVLS